MKVYELVHFSQLDGEVIITTKVYSTREKAMEAYMKESKCAEEDTRKDIDDVFLNVDRDDERMRTDIYDDGYDTDYKITIEVIESEVL